MVLSTELWKPTQNSAIIWNANSRTQDFNISVLKLVSRNTLMGNIQVPKWLIKYLDID